MNWRIDDHPEGGLQITHLVAPRFTARWTTGEFPIEAIKDGEFFWTDEGSGEEDTIHFYGFEWLDPPPNRLLLSQTVLSAVRSVENEIMLG